MGMYDKWAPPGQGPIPGAPAPPLGSATAAHIYRKAEAVGIYKRLAAAKGLTLPPGVDREDASLFAEAGQPDVLDVLAGIHEPGNGDEPPAAAAAAGRATEPSPPTTQPPLPRGETPEAAKPQEEQQRQEHSAAEVATEPPATDDAAERRAENTDAAPSQQQAADEWVYQDPQGIVQVGAQP